VIEIARINVKAIIGQKSELLQSRGTKNTTHTKCLHRAPSTEEEWNLIKLII
jgi:hypothetical protein